MDIIRDLQELTNNNRNIAGKNQKIDYWLSWYKGKVDDFHKYREYNGEEFVSREKKTLGMAKEVCEKWANLLMNEKTTITLPEELQERFDNLFLKTNFWSKANKGIEKAFALSNFAIVLRVNNILTNSVDEVVNYGDLSIDFVNATNVYPITYENDVITECAFVSENSKTKVIACHLIDEESKNYIIKTRIYRFKNNQWIKDNQDLEFDTKSNKRWFFIYSPNIVNNDDIDKANGISVYANAIDILKSIDNLYDGIDNEFETGNRKVFLESQIALRVDEDGNKIRMFDPKAKSYYVLPKGQTDTSSPLIKEYTPALRCMDYINALDSQLSKLGERCGFGKNYFSFSNGTMGRPIQTATGVISMQSDLYRNIHKHEIPLEEMLVELVLSIIYVSNTFTNEKYPEIEASDISVNFDDSIFEDKESEKDSARKDVSLGVMSMVEYRKKFYGETTEDAEENLKKFSITELAKKIELLLPSVTAKVVSPAMFVELVFGDIPNKQELITYIENGLQSSSINVDDMLGQFGA